MVSQTAETAPTALDWRAVVKAYCELGATDRQLAALFGVPQTTVAGWMVTLPEFADAVSRGRLVADRGVENGLFRVAVGCTLREERVMMRRRGPVTVRISKERAPDYKACVAWLSNRQPERWGRGRTHERAHDELAVSDAFAVPLLPEGETDPARAEAAPPILAAAGKRALHVLPAHCAEGPVSAGAPLAGTHRIADLRIAA